MQTIKNYITQFLQAEAKASEALVKPNLEDYNNKLEQMNSFCVKELHNKFGMVPRTELWDDDFYEEWQDTPSPNPRNIYKISHYHDERFGDVYIVYLSGKNPIERIFRYGECVFVSNNNDELKIVKNYTFGYDDRKIKKRFETGIGLKAISFETLQKPIVIERYMPPTNDKDAMEHYAMDI